jgi:hypothetical protein
METGRNDGAVTAEDMALAGELRRRGQAAR